MIKSTTIISAFIFLTFSGFASATSTSHNSNHQNQQPAEFWSDCAVGSDCQVYSVLGVNDNALKSNGEPVISGMHGIDNWSFLAKAESDDDEWEIEGSNIFNFSVNGNEQSGNWSVNNLWNSYDSIALVFKDGSNTSLVSYIFSNGEQNDSFTSPFTHEMFTGVRNTKDISHISLYGVEHVSSVPLPAASWLFVGGLMTLIGFRKNKIVK